MVRKIPIMETVEEGDRKLPRGHLFGHARARMFPALLAAEATPLGAVSAGLLGAEAEKPGPAFSRARAPIC